MDLQILYKPFNIIMAYSFLSIESESLQITQKRILWKINQHSYYVEPKFNWIMYLLCLQDKMSTKKFDAQNMVNVSTEDSCTDVFVIWIVDKIPKDFENVTTLLKSTGVLPIVILISDKQQSAVKVRDKSMFSLEYLGKILHA